MEDKMNKKKKYPIRPTEKQLNLMKLYWAMLGCETTRFYAKVSDLEKKMCEDTGIKDLEFFQCDNEFVGIGNYDRTLKLIHREELEK
jgi:hypothetical protein